MVSLVSRVVGVHRLLLVNFYPFLQRYLQPHQRDVTQLLAALVQVSTAIPPSNFKCGSCAVHSAVQCRTARCMLMQVARICGSYECICGARSFVLVLQECAGRWW